MKGTYLIVHGGQLTLLPFFFFRKPTTVRRFPPIHHTPLVRCASTNRLHAQVRQMRHVIAARVLQDAKTPPQTTGGGRPSNPAGVVGWGDSSGAANSGLDGLDLLAGMASNDTDYRKVRLFTWYCTGGPTHSASLAVAAFWACFLPSWTSVLRCCLAWWYLYLYMYRFWCMYKEAF